MVYTTHLTLRPITSIGWLPSITSYDDNSGGEIKADDYCVGDYESVQVDKASNPRAEEMVDAFASFEIY